MNPWDIDPSLYASLWKMLREWHSKRKASNIAPDSLPKSGRSAGCRA